MGQKLSDQEFHALYCPVRNTKSALFLVGCFSVLAFVSWKGLHKPSAHLSLFELLFAIVVFAMLAKSLVAFTCFRERLVFGVAVVSFVIGAAVSLAPSMFSKYAELVGLTKLALSLLGLLVSLTMLVQSTWRPRVEPRSAESIAGKPTRNLPILLGATLILLFLGALLYFLPLR